jgi:hypothetical protein
MIMFTFTIASSPSASRCLPPGLRSFTLTSPLAVIHFRHNNIEEKAEGVIAVYSKGGKVKRDVEKEFRMDEVT